MIGSDCPCHGSTLDRLLRPAILFCLEEEAQHGYQIAKRLGSFRMFKGGDGRGKQRIQG